jgi:hypothetical protein
VDCPVETAVESTDSTSFAGFVQARRIATGSRKRDLFIMYRYIKKCFVMMELKMRK